MAIDDDLDDLLNNTKAFLDNNLVVIFSAPGGASGNLEFVLEKTIFTGWTSSAGPVPRYACYPASWLVIGGGSGLPSQKFDAQYISMREYDTGSQSWEPNATTHYPLDANGPAVMLTSKLNGCTFGIGSDAGGTRLVSHLRPPRLLEVPMAEGRLILNDGMRAGFAGGTLQVSIMSSDQMNGTIIGIQTGTAWTFYAQRFHSVSPSSGVLEGVNVYH